MNLDEAIARTKEASESQRLGELGRETALQLAEWLEELKQYKEQYKEQNQETNLDHFQQEGRPERCDRTKCADCELSKDRSRGCHAKVMNWLKQPRKAPAIKLTKFEIDLLQSCSQGYSPEYQFKNINSLTEMRKKGYFKGVDRDATLENILANSEITEED